MGREDDNNAEQIRLESLYILLVKANNVKLQMFLRTGSKELSDNGNED